MNEPSDPQHTQQEPDSTEPRPMKENEVRQWTMFMHVGLLMGFTLPVLGALTPAVMWLLRWDRSERVDRHGAMLVNAALSYHGYLLVTFLLSLFVFGILPFLMLFAALVTIPVIGAVKANDGVFWSYPCVREFVKWPSTESGHGADGTAEPAQYTERQAA